MSDSPVIIREARLEERPFIYSHWLESFRKSNFARGIRDQVYFKGHHDLVERILSTATVYVAANRELDRQLHGFICFEMSWDIPVFHYVYVKFPYRGFGIARRLFEEANLGRTEPFLYTHDTCLAEKIGARGIYSPYQLFNREGKTS